MKPKRVLKIATRDSALALRQAEMVTKKLKAIGVSSKLVFIKSKGDLGQKNPVQSLNSVGIFTKAIDDAVIMNKADLGVHSLKDLPTVIHLELVLCAVLKREDPHDVIVFRDKDFTKRKNHKATVATGSVRRKAQWLNKFPHHIIVPVRGNVDSRLKKLKESDWDGMILAAAGLKRLKIKVNCKKLDWMIPAPGQGAIAVVARRKDVDVTEVLSRLNHQNSFLEVTTEREFLSAIGAGCSTPVGAMACALNGKLHFSAQVLSPDGKRNITVELTDKLENAKKLGQKAVAKALEKGAKKLLLTH